MFKTHNKMEFWSYECACADGCDAECNERRRQLCRECAELRRDCRALAPIQRIGGELGKRRRVQRARVETAFAHHACASIDDVARVTCQQINNTNK